MVPFYILGSWDSIPKAAALLQEHVSYLKVSQSSVFTVSSVLVKPLRVLTLTFSLLLSLTNLQIIQLSTSVLSVEFESQ